MAPSKMLNTRIGENYNLNEVVNSNDLRKRIINVDSRFRADICGPTTDFTYKLEHPYKNLIRLRIASVEVPNMFYVFTKANNSFVVKAYDITGIVRTVTITIAEGNYCSADLITTLQNLFNTCIRDPFGIFLTISLNPVNAKVTIMHNGVAPYPVTGTNPLPTQSAKPFILDFNSSVVSLKKRKTNWGLGYNLGYRQHAIKVTNHTPSPLVPALTAYYQIAEACIDVVGETYMFLCVNDYYSVEQKTDENYFQCLAKIIIREDKFMVIYDDGSATLTNDIIFPSPTDLKILQVKLVDPYGEPVNLCGMNFSFSLEITEVLNTRLYDFYRNYIWLGTIPSVPYKTVQGAAQPLLKGLGPPF